MPSVLLNQVRLNYNFNVNTRNPSVGECHGMISTYVLNHSKTLYIYYRLGIVLGLGLNKI